MKKMSEFMMVVAALVVILTGSVLTAHAADPAAETGVKAGATSAPSQWRFAIPIGYYAFGIEGPAGVGNREVDLDLDAGDVSDKLDTAAGFAFEFGKGKWTGLTSITYLKFEGDDRNATTPLGQAFNAQPSLEWTTLQAGVAYRALSKGKKPGKAFILEPVAFIRSTKLDGTIDVNSPPALAGDRSRDTNWQDVLVGLRLVKFFTPHFSLSFLGDYGIGFAGNDQPSWDVAAQLGWRFPFDNWSMTVAAGYMDKGIELEDDDTLLRLDLTFSGPTLGVRFDW